MASSLIHLEIIIFPKIEQSSSRRSYRYKWIICLTRRRTAIQDGTKRNQSTSVLSSMKYQLCKNTYQHYINCCSGFGIADIKNTVDQMIVVDFIRANEDRHLSNFGILRDANTLKCKQFKTIHEEQLKLVTSSDWINFVKLRQVVPEIRDIFLDSGEYTDETRTEAIVSSLVRRIDRLEAIAKSHRQFLDDIAFDLAEDIAAQY